MWVPFTSPTESKLDRFINNGDLSSDRNHWIHRHTHRLTDRQTDTVIAAISSMILLKSVFFIRHSNKTWFAQRYRLVIPSYHFLF